MSDLVAFGEILIDFAPINKDLDNYPTLKANPGGAPANFLAAASKYGTSCGLIGKVGNDQFGKLLIDTVKNCNINTTNLLVDNDFFTTLAFVSIDDNGERSFSFSRKHGADTNIDFNEIDLTEIEKCKVFHFGTVSLTFGKSKETNIKLVKYAKEKGKIISFDPNLREPLWNDLIDAYKAIDFGLANSDIVKISDNEVDFICKKRGFEAVDYLLEKYPNIKILYITCGSKGVYYSNRKYSNYLESIKVNKVIDTTGAGDIFSGSCMHKLLSLNKNIEDISKNEFDEIVKFGIKCSGLSVTKLGAIPSIPNIDEIC